MKWKERFLILFLILAILLLLVNRRNLNNTTIHIPLVQIDNDLIIDRRNRNTEIDLMNLNSKLEKTEQNNNEINNNDNVIVDPPSLWDEMHPWDIWEDMVENRRITPISEKHLNLILDSMRSSNIVSVDKGYRGTQLKAVFYLHGPEKQKTVFKPKRYSRDRILDGTPYEGYDRHNSEIAAFYLDRILGFYRTPPVVGRYVNLKTQVLPVCTASLAETFFQDGRNLCFYGKCMYCNQLEPACANGDIMEGSLTLWLPRKWKIANMRHPWQRTYKKGVKAIWEYDMDYCKNVVKKPPYNKGPRLLDIMDTSIFDFLIGNADRHHYEYLKDEGNNGMLLNMDNGKGFGTPFKDETSILAPIYQCCKLRQSTYDRLLKFSTDTSSSSSLSSMLASRLRHDAVHPVLTADHLKAIDRRLITVMKNLDTCFEKIGKETVLVHDNLE